MTLKHNLKKFLPAPWWLIFPSLFLILPACRTFTMEAPKDFMVYDKQPEPFRAISAEGVRLKARSIKNEPKGDLALWTEYLEMHLKSKGYLLKEKKEIQNSQGLKGMYLTSLYQYSGQNFAYLAALYVNKDNIFLIESAGTYPDFEKHRDNIIIALKSFRPGS
jgi:hypothetical protein